MPQIHVRNLTKRFGSHTAVDGIDFSIADGSFTTLLGPSGCGKTTTLRMLAGFERPDGGTIQIGDRVVARGSGREDFVPPQRRDLGVVFQSYALWPHMTVYDQIAYPLRAHGVNRAVIRTKVEAMLDLVMLPNAGPLLPNQLSGGQQQRVALARALVIEPAVLLLDEPMSNLDAALRAQMRDELAAIHRRIAVTTVYVTHDQSEALALSDQVLVMRKGRIIESGAPWAIYDQPSTAYGARFVGNSNCIPVRLQAAGSGQWRIELRSGRTLSVDLTGGSAIATPEVTVAIKPEDISVHPMNATESNTLPAKVKQSTYLGARTEVVVDCEGLVLRATAPKLWRLTEGEDVLVQLPSEALRVLPDGAGEQED